jgi:hypothetical protein
MTVFEATALRLCFADYFQCAIQGLYYYKEPVYTVVEDDGQTLVQPWLWFSYEGLSKDQGISLDAVKTCSVVSGHFCLPNLSLNRSGKYLMFQNISFHFCCCWEVPKASDTLNRGMALQNRGTWVNEQFSTLPFKQNVCEAGIYLFCGVSNSFWQPKVARVWNI